MAKQGFHFGSCTEDISDHFKQVCTVKFLFHMVESDLFRVHIRPYKNDPIQQDLDPDPHICLKSLDHSNCQPYGEPLVDITGSVYRTHHSINHTPIPRTVGRLNELSIYFRNARGVGGG
jgi:hypothetical protein